MNYRRQRFVATTGRSDSNALKYESCFEMAQDAPRLTCDAARTARASRHRRQSHPVPATRSRPTPRLRSRATAARPRAVCRARLGCLVPCRKRSSPRRRLLRRTRARTAPSPRAHRVRRARADRAPAHHVRQPRARAARGVFRTGSRRSRARRSPAAAVVRNEPHRARRVQPVTAAFDGGGAFVRLHSQRSASIGSSRAAFRAG